MSNKFLGTTSAEDLTNGSINIVGATISAANLIPSKALKTDALGRLYSTNLQTSDIDGYAGTNWNRVAGTPSYLTPAIGGDYVATDNVRSVDGATTMIAHNKLQYANTETISDDKDLVSKKYVDDSISVENLWDRTGTDLKPYFTGDGIQVNDIASETSGNIAVADDVNMASTKQLKFPAENQDKIDIDTNWKIGTNSGNLRFHNSGDTTDYVAFRWGGADKLRIEENGSDVDVYNPNGTVHLESVEIGTGGIPNINNVNKITYQDENNSQKIIFKENGSAVENNQHRFGIVSNYSEFNCPTGNGYRWQFQGVDKMQLHETDGLELASGATVNEFSIDGQMLGNSDDAVPTEKAVKTFVNLEANANAGTISVSGFSITDNLDGTVDIGSGDCYLRNSNSDSAPIARYTVSGVSGQALTDNSENYIYVDYNAGSPQLAVAVSGSTIRDNENTLFELYEIYRAGTALTITEHKQKAFNVGGKLQQFLYEKFYHTRTSGLILGESADNNRNVTVTAGNVWIKLNKIAVSAIDTSGADTFDRYYYNGASWVTQSAQTIWDNTQYNNTASGLVTMTNNRYSFQEYFILGNGKMISVYGDAEYITLAGAENAAVLSTIPDIGEHATYVGRIVFEKSVTIADAVLSPFTVTLSTGGVTDHGSLSGLADDDHTQYALLNGRNGNILKIDDIQEYTDSHGVQIDDVLIQDRKVFPGGLYGMDVQGGNILALTSNNYIALDDSIRVLKGGFPAIVTTNSKNLYLYSTVASTGFTQISDNNNSQILKLWNSDKHIDASGPIEVLAHSVAGDSLTINGNSAGDSYMTLSRTASTDNIGFKFKTGSTQLWQLGSLSSQDDFKLINAATGNEAIQVNKSTNYVRLQYGMQLNNSAVTARYIYDEDDMSSNSNQALATQQSIKAYCENKGGRFNARMTSGVNDVTGDGTYYTCIFNTEDTDYGSIYNNGTGICTVNKTGDWQFSVTLKSDGYLSGHTSLLVVFTTSSLGGIYAHECNPYNTGSGTNKQITSSATVIIPLTSGDTVKVEIRSAGGTKVVDVASTSTFSGRFIG